MSTSSWAVRSIRPDALVEYIPNRVPPQGMDTSGPGKVSDHFASYCLLSDVNLCNTTLIYLILDWSRMIWTVASFTCWILFHGKYQEAIEDSWGLRVLQAASCYCFERCTVVFARIPQTKGRGLAQPAGFQPVGTILAARLRWAKAMAWNRI